METLPRLPGYRIEEMIGRGAMSSVYRGIQEGSGRPVAIKLLNPGLASDPALNRRLMKEAQIVGGLAHPNIIAIVDEGTVNGLHYIVMEYLAGGTLREQITAGLNPVQAVRILVQIAGALGYAHRQNYVHCDIKPANILFRNAETAVLSDFGIARQLGDIAPTAVASWRIGTPNYMSPEQALAHAVDRRSDLYSLGIVFYEMLTGQRWVQGRDAFESTLHHLSAPLPVLPPSLCRYQLILNRLLAKKPLDRFATSEALVQALEQLNTPSRLHEAIFFRMVRFHTLLSGQLLHSRYRWLIGLLVALITGVAVVVSQRFLGISSNPGLP